MSPESRLKIRSDLREIIEDFLFIKSNNYFEDRKIVGVRLHDNPADVLQLADEILDIVEDYTDAIIESSLEEFEKDLEESFSSNDEDEEDEEEEEEDEEDIVEELGEVLKKLGITNIKLENLGDRIKVTLKDANKKADDEGDELKIIANLIGELLAKFETKRGK